MTGRTWRMIIIIVIALIAGGIIGMSLVGRPQVWQPPVAPETPPPATSDARPLGLTLHGQVQAARVQQIVAPTAAKVVALAAPEGQPLAEGQPILHLDDPGLRERLAAARANLEKLRALQEKARDPLTQQRLEAAQARVDEGQVRLTKAREALQEFAAKNAGAASLLDTYVAVEERANEVKGQYERVQTRFNQLQDKVAKTGKPTADFLAAQREFERLTQQHREAQSQFEQAREARSRSRHEITQLSLLRRRVASSENILADLRRLQQQALQTPEAKMFAEGEQRVQQAKAALAKLEQQQGGLAIKAPVSGTLSAIKVRPGQQVKAGQVLAVIQEAGGARLVFQAGQDARERLAVGQRAKFSADNGEWVTAAVSQIVPLETSVRVYLVPVGKGSVPAPGTALTATL